MIRRRNIVIRTIDKATTTPLNITRNVRVVVSIRRNARTEMIVRVVICARSTSIH